MDELEFYNGQRSGEEIDELAVQSDLASIHATGSTNTTGATIAAGTYFYLNGVLVRAKTAIANGATFTENTNYEAVTAGGLNELKSAIDNLYNMEIGVEHETPETFLGKRVYCKALSVPGSYPAHASGDVQVLATGLSQGASIIRAGAFAKYGSGNVFTTPYANETTNIHFYADGYTYNNSGNAWQARVLIVNDTAFSDLVVWAYYTKG